MRLYILSLTLQARHLKYFEVKSEKEKTIHIRSIVLRLLPHGTGAD
jgi:hypothetical protein